VPTAADVNCLVAPTEYSASNCSTCLGRFYRTFSARVARWMWLPVAFASTMAALSWFNVLQLLLLSVTLPASYHSVWYRRLSVAALTFVSIVTGVELVFAVPGLFDFSPTLLRIGFFLPPSDKANYTGSVQTGSYLLLRVISIILLTFDIIRLKMFAQYDGSKRFTALQLFDAASCGDLSVLQLAASSTTEESVQSRQLALVGARGGLLHVAAEYGQLDAVLFLLGISIPTEPVINSRGSPRFVLNILAVDSNGNSALHVARKSGYKSIESALVSAARTRSLYSELKVLKNSSGRVWNHIYPSALVRLRIRISRCVSHFVLLSSSFVNLSIVFFIL
jgi:hypothetical protein